MRELFESTSDLVFTLDKDGRVRTANPTCLSVTGMSSQQLLGKSWSDLVDESQRQRYTDIGRRAWQGENVRVHELAVRANDGGLAWLDGQIARSRTDVTDDVVLCFLHDVTERRTSAANSKALNRDLVRRSAELAAARTQAEAADRLKSAFLATMSHELRTPLNSILGFTGIMLQGMAGEVSEEQVKQLGMVKNSAKHLLALINDVLDISKIEAGQLTLAEAPFDPQASLHTLPEMTAPLAAAKDLAFNV